MADPWRPEQRRRLMQRVRTKDTAPEVALRQALWAAGIRGWRLHSRSVVGKPDLAWIGRRLAVFVDGAFWHGHPAHYWGQSGPFWDAKIQRNRERDRAVDKELAGTGWTVIRFWDFEVENELERCVEDVRAALSSVDIPKR
jgi:DNA mismatch endonuclease, patch repair protein